MSKIISQDVIIKKLKGLEMTDIKKIVDIEAGSIWFAKEEKNDDGLIIKVRDKGFRQKAQMNELAVMKKFASEERKGDFNLLVEPVNFLVCDTDNTKTYRNDE